jgi:hypothetical protein
VLIALERKYRSSHRLEQRATSANGFPRPRSFGVWMNPNGVVLHTGSCVCVQLLYYIGTQASPPPHSPTATARSHRLPLASCRNLSYDTMRYGGVVVPDLAPLSFPLIVDLLSTPRVDTCSEAELVVYPNPRHFCTLSLLRGVLICYNLVV